VQSADRALAILAAFNGSRRDLGVSELAAELGLHKSTVSRLLATLEARGFVRRDRDRFAPGFELVRLGGVASLSGISLAPVALDALEQLGKETNETVNLAVRDGKFALNVHQVQTTHRVGVGDWTGRQAPLHCTANGKALLAFGGGSLPTHRLDPHTQKTITRPERLRAELERVRNLGYATAQEELEVGLNAAAAPVFDASGVCVAAVSVSGPSYRLGEERLAEVGMLCVSAADEISERLGHRRAA
jgi:IclR family transcriptional regulator, acetate operon repressor